MPQGQSEWFKGKSHRQIVCLASPKKHVCWSLLSRITVIGERKAQKRLYKRLSRLPLREYHLRHDISLSLVSKQNRILKENWHLTELNSSETHFLPLSLFKILLFCQRLDCLDPRISHSPDPESHPPEFFMLFHHAVENIKIRTNFRLETEI